MAGSFKSDECECAINFLASKPFTSFALNATKHFHFTSMLNDTGPASLPSLVKGPLERTVAFDSRKGKLVDAQPMEVP